LERDDVGVCGCGGGAAPGMARGDDMADGDGGGSQGAGCGGTCGAAVSSTQGAGRHSGAWAIHAARSCRGHISCAAAPAAAASQLLLHIPEAKP
jgi:hypothetical protein